MSTIRFPGETPDYRQARDRLLQAEIELSRKTEEVAALRRDLPLGGKVTQDYVFATDKGTVRLSELFGDKKTLVFYSFMYGPQVKAPCPMCTSFLDALDRQAQHITQRVALAVVAKSPIARIREFANSRGWTTLRLVSSADTTYQRDYHGEDDKADQWPMMNVLSKTDGGIHHFWGSEMLYAKLPPGQESRHIDTMWPLWNVLDLTPEGRGDHWHPALRYER